MTLKNHMTVEATTVPQNHVLTDHTVGANVAVGPKAGIGVNDGGRMDHGC